MKGIYPQVPENEYFAAKAASNSTLSRMKRSPAHCRAYMDDQPEPTANMKFGSLVHCLTLEPGEFAGRYHIADEYDPTMPRGEVPKLAIEAMSAGDFETKFFKQEGSAPRKPAGMALTIAERLINSEGIDKFITEPAMNKRTKEGKEKFAAFQRKCEADGLTVCKPEHIDNGVEYADHILQIGERQVITESEFIKAQNYANYLQAINGKEVISQDQFETAEAVVKSIRKHPKASVLLSGGQAEVSLFWDDADTGYQCKARVDYLRPGHVLVDLKTTVDASLEEFKRSIAKFGYHRQQPIYKDGYKAVTGNECAAFVFIAVETKPPYAVGVYMLDDESEQKGRDEYQSLLKQFAECQESGEWPAYSDDIEIIELPGWYK
jgi:exodeoxyribonuclease VIII